MKEEDIVVGSEFRAKRVMYLRTLDDGTYELQPPGLLWVVFVSISSHMCICRCETNGILVDTAWKHKTIVKLVNNEGLEPLPCTGKTGSSENKAKNVNDTNENCYFCGKPTQALMGQSRYCPRCQK